MLNIDNFVFPEINPIMYRQKLTTTTKPELEKILVISSYPPRECGIATYSQDLISALNNKFSSSLSLKVCALESGHKMIHYPEEVQFRLDTSQPNEYKKLAKAINHDTHIQIVLLQHEFGFFKNNEHALLEFLYELTKPVAIVFHSVLPHPTEQMKAQLKNIAGACESIVVMTNNSFGILSTDYEIPEQKISVIAHGTHLVPHLSEHFLKLKYDLKDRKVLTTFGLLSSGKSIETTIEALPAIIKKSPEVVFLIIGKTHPEVVKNEGEIYRDRLEQMVHDLKLEKHVIFINQYLALPELLEYLQLTDIYLFTTNDPNQAVSGTFAYAMSCACPIISTPIPHAREFLTKDTGIIFDFKNSKQLAEAVILLLSDDGLRRSISSNTLQSIVSTAWENSAAAHARLFEKMSNGKLKLKYDFPEINLSHLQKMTTEMGILQFSKVNQPDIESGYTLDDNARALIAAAMYFRLTKKKSTLHTISKYLHFIEYCMQPDGNLLNYVDKNKRFTEQNYETNLDDSNGRALWALGYIVSLAGELPSEFILLAEGLIEKMLPRIESIHSTRSMAFAIKGLSHYYDITKAPAISDLITVFANRLVQMYKHESEENWKWFEGYMTYANSILPEAMLHAWITTGTPIYKDIALKSFDFLLKHTFNENGIEVISNRSWWVKGEPAAKFGEQPIDVAYTIMTLSKFFDVFGIDDYKEKMTIAFNWFLGCNRLQQIIYNPCTGGCYDGLEEKNVNINQGAESTVSYLMARMTVEQYKKPTILQ
ncbi:MAG: glycosyltransferase [Bacteroidales bacterium]|nr:glycosyltransferase [Bacteroidales bacterium]